MCTPSGIETCHLSLFPVGLLGGRKIKARILRQSHPRALHDMRFEPLSPCNFQLGALTAGLTGVRQACPLSSPAAGQKVQASQAERSDAVVAQCPLSLYEERTEARGARERRGESSRFQEGEGGQKGKGKQ